MHRHGLEKGGEMNIEEQLRKDAEQWRRVGNFNIAQVMTAAADKIDALQARVTTLQSLLDQRWEMMRELEEACGAKDVAKAVEYIKGLKTRVQRLEEALEIGVGLNRARELMSDNHVGEPNEMVAVTKEVPCPDCYGGHFRPCNICGDSGVALLRIETKESKP